MLCTRLQSGCMALGMKSFHCHHCRRQTATAGSSAFLTSGLSRRRWGWWRPRHHCRRCALRSVLTCACTKWALITPFWLSMQSCVAAGKPAVHVATYILKIVWN